jgi:maleylacetate reductase
MPCCSTIRTRPISTGEAAEPRAVRDLQPQSGQAKGRTMIEPGIYRYPRMDRVAFGRPWEQVLAEEVERLGASRVFAIAGSTLAGTVPLAAAMREALGERLAGFTTGIRAHTPRDDVIAAAAKAREARADLIVTIGGGSVTDAGKMVLLCLAADAKEPQALDALRPGGPALEKIRTLPVRAVAIPTTLSGGEFTPIAGCTDVVKRLKEGFFHPEMIPQAVILDPRITPHTPMRLWLSTGIRAVDHAVETLCSIHPQPLFEATSAHALRLLQQGLIRTKHDPSDLDARLESMLGVWLSLIGIQSGAPMAASHGIGHVLGGTAGVPHGFTSCVMLPHVLRWNKSANADRQALVSAAFGEPQVDAGDLVADLVRKLELPATLREVGVTREQLDLIAQNSMHDRAIATNPRQIHGPEDVREILELAW